MITSFSSNGASLQITELGSGDVDVVWAHGWGQSREAFLPIAEGLVGYHHLLLDFPGFGGTAAPPVPWGTVEYASLTASWLATLPRKQRIWVGHSFGCRVGIRLASGYPNAVDGLFLIAAAGIRPPLPILNRVSRAIRSQCYALLKQVLTSEASKEWLRQRWGSQDYKRAGAMRGTFVAVVNENLIDEAKKITLPVRLVYGELDSETPPIVGRIYQSAMRNAQLTLLPRYGHLDILTNGRFQLQGMVRDFLRSFQR